MKRNKKHRKKKTRKYRHSSVVSKKKNKSKKSNKKTSSSPTKGFCKKSFEYLKSTLKGIVFVIIIPLVISLLASFLFDQYKSSLEKKDTEIVKIIVIRNSI